MSYTDTTDLLLTISPVTSSRWVPAAVPAGAAAAWAASATAGVTVVALSGAWEVILAEGRSLKGARVVDRLLLAVVVFVYSRGVARR